MASAAIGIIEVNISIKGRLIYVDYLWNVEFGLLNYRITSNSPLLCFKTLEQKFRKEMNDENLKCFFEIEDSGFFYMVSAQTPELINFLAENLTNLDDMSVDPDLED